MNRSRKGRPPGRGRDCEGPAGATVDYRASTCMRNEIAQLARCALLPDPCHCDQRPDSGDLGQALTDRIGAMPGQNHRLDLSDAPVELIELPDEKTQDRASGLRHRSMRARSRPTFQMPCGSTIPISAKWPRSAFTI